MGFALVNQFENVFLAVSATGVLATIGKDHDDLRLWGFTSSNTLGDAGIGFVNDESNRIVQRSHSVNDVVLWGDGTGLFHIGQLQNASDSWVTVAGWELNDADLRDSW